MTVYSIGGSVVEEHLDEIHELADAVAESAEVAVTGAGSLSEYVEASSGNHAEADLVGIRATRLHAQLLLSEIRDSNRRPPESFEELAGMADRRGTVVSGGMVPGYSTDAVAATAAELTGDDLVIATSVEGVYTGDPDSGEERRLEEVSVERLQELTRGNSRAGGHELLDRTAIDIIERSGIRTRVVEGSPESVRDPETVPGTDVKLRDR